MIGFLIGRTVQALLVMLGVAFLAFALSTYVGDPVTNMVGQEASLEDRAELRLKLGLDDPIPVRFARFLGEVGQGNFGISYRLQQPVDALIAERLPATVELVGMSAVLAIVLGLPLGMLAAVRPRWWVSRLVMGLSLAGVSLPTFVIGILLIYLFSVTLGWLPSSGRGDTVIVGGWQTGLLTLDGWRSIILPSITLALFQATVIMRLTRAQVMEVLRSDMITFARARGLSWHAIHLRHALRNALLPVITVTALNIGALIAFSIVTETVFQWPGMGFLFIQAVLFADIPVMTAYLVMAALVFVVLNLVVDVLYGVLDPRLRDRVRGRAA